MIYVYRQKSKSAWALVEAIRDEGREVVRWKNIHDLVPNKSDLVVNWGAYIEHWPGKAEILNRHVLGDKFKELQLIHKAGVETPEIRVDKPVGGKWIARKFNHFEADDVRANLEYGDYYTKWLDIDKEFRFHVFNGTVLQTQFKKAVKPGAHDWIRSWATGWDWKNGGQDLTPAMYKSACEAVEACGYDFGAVDIGRLANHGFVVLEVNTAPGFDVGGTTCYKYANACIEASKD